MNQFNLDPLNHLSGEIVTIRIEVYDALGSFTAKVERKIKNRSKTSAINAFHMHRALCRGLKDEILWLRDVSLTTRELASVKKLIGKIVLRSYIDNAFNHCQYYAYTVWVMENELTYVRTDLGSNPAISD